MHRLLRILRSVLISYDHFVVSSFACVERRKLVKTLVCKRRLTAPFVPLSIVSLIHADLVNRWYRDLTLLAPLTHIL